MKYPLLTTITQQQYKVRLFVFICKPIIGKTIVDSQYCNANGKCSVNAAMWFANTEQNVILLTAKTSETKHFEKKNTHTHKLKPIYNSSFLWTDFNQYGSVCDSWFSRGSLLLFLRYFIFFFLQFTSLHNFLSLVGACSERGCVCVLDAYWCEKTFYKIQMKNMCFIPAKQLFVKQNFLMFPLCFFNSFVVIIALESGRLFYICYPNSARDIQKGDVISPPKICDGIRTEKENAGRTCNFPLKFPRLNIFFHYLSLSLSLSLSSSLSVLSLLTGLIPSHPK